ncbi:MAG: hypothetical protein M2R45_03673 [Verrucomicrobia subdivision 3 bacterium]|nr:hypothetical protein [Limisphaerales bacterium]MCS1412698.1 hypothetical protein [Limisphaerales bacterium]
MNKSLFPPNDPESRITAYLLGQLPPEDHAEVEDQINAEPELAVLAARLKKTIDLLHQAVPDSIKQPVAKPSDELRFSNDRRQTLLAQLAEEPTQVSITGTGAKHTVPWYVPMGIAAGLLVILTVLALPSGSVQIAAAHKDATRTYAPEAPSEASLTQSPQALPLARQSGQWAEMSTSATRPTQPPNVGFELLPKAEREEKELDANQPMMPRYNISAQAVAKVRPPVELAMPAPIAVPSVDADTENKAAAELSFGRALGEVRDKEAVPQLPANSADYFYARGYAQAAPEPSQVKASPHSIESQRAVEQQLAKSRDSRLLGERLQEAEGRARTRSEAIRAADESLEVLARLPDGDQDYKTFKEVEPEIELAREKNAGHALGVYFGDGLGVESVVTGPMTAGKSIDAIKPQMAARGEPSRPNASWGLRATGAAGDQFGGAAYSERFRYGGAAGIGFGGGLLSEPVSGLARGRSANKDFGSMALGDSGVTTESVWAFQKMGEQENSPPSDNKALTKGFAASADGSRLLFDHPSAGESDDLDSLASSFQAGHGLALQESLHGPAELEDLGRQNQSLERERAEDKVTLLAGILTESKSNLEASGREESDAPARELSVAQNFGLEPKLAKLSDLKATIDQVELWTRGASPTEDPAFSLGNVVIDEQESASTAAEDAANEIAEVNDRSVDHLAVKKKVETSRSLRDRTKLSKGLKQLERSVERQRETEPSFNRQQDTRANPTSTFSLNVSDVSFRLAAASLDQGVLPAPSTIRPEEFFNAFAYHDPITQSDEPIAVHTERARFPFEHRQDILRISVRTKSTGRSRQTPLNVVILLDRSGSMERPDRQAISRRALKSLVSSLLDQDRISIIAFARETRLWADGLPGNQAMQALNQLGNLIPEGGTNLEAALVTAYAIAKKHFMPKGLNRVILLTDGAANLGNTDAESLRLTVESHRKAGIALDCFGIGWDGYDDHRLETLTRNGDGRYAFLNDITQVETDFSRQLTGVLNVAAKNVKVQITFNEERVTSYRQIGYARHQLKKEAFRDGTTDAAELAAAETGTALYVLMIDPEGSGPIGDLSLRYQDPKTKAYRELSRSVPYQEPVVDLKHASAAMKLAAASGIFAEWLAGIPYSQDVDLKAIQQLISQTQSGNILDPAVSQFENMVLQAQSLAGL